MTWQQWLLAFGLIWASAIAMSRITRGIIEDSSSLVGSGIVALFGQIILGGILYSANFWGHS